MDFEINAFNSHLDSLVCLNCELNIHQEKICELLCLGLNVPEIASKLYKSNHTIEWHIKKIKAKTKIHSTTMIACWYFVKKMQRTTGFSSMQI